MQSSSKPTAADLRDEGYKADADGNPTLSCALYAGAEALEAVARVRALALNIRNRAGIAEFLRTIISNEILAALSPEEKPN